MTRRDFVAVALLTIFVAATYGARMTAQPLVGEETRWATGAREMLATGDWIVPRQQGRVFPERPPMTMWLMAAVGWFRGDVDPIAIRLPSVVAVVLTSLIIFGYTRAIGSTFAATVAALAYATMGQVLQIGRQGESEAVFALLVSASLFIWHTGYMRAWRPIIVWTAGLGLAALAALVKGPQAPVYFAAITAAYLVLRRDWRYLIRWQYVVGAAVFAAIIFAWQIPFYRATGWSAVVATWSGLAADRLYLSGILSHAITYPIETFVCMLPWSPILVAMVHRETRASLVPISLRVGYGEGALARRNSVHQTTAFIITAVFVAYPTVWFAAGARGRYFMPLYPLIAVLIGLIIERCCEAAVGTYPRRAWHQFILLWAACISAFAIIVGSASSIGHHLADRLTAMRTIVGGPIGRWCGSVMTVCLDQPRWFSLTFALLAAIAASILWLTFRKAQPFRPLMAIAAIATIAATGATGFMINVNAARWIDPTNGVALMKSRLPANVSLVSLSPIEHRFAYYYGEPIAEIGWPVESAQLPANVDYFCFMRAPGDTADGRAAGRGRTWYKTPGTLPFEWQEIASICVERQVYDDHPRMVVLGRVVRPLRPAKSDVTIPQLKIAKELPGTKVQ